VIHSVAAARLIPENLGGAEGTAPPELAESRQLDREHHFPLKNSENLVEIMEEALTTCADRQN